MRAAQMTERPEFTLMTQNDVQNSCYMQMPRWLFSDPRYAPMSLDAKVAYTFLLNRFQLSRMNGWVNDQGEVFVIFPRKELAKELRICEQKVTAALRKLAELDLVWEKRCGRGEANQIYLAKVNPQSDPGYSCAPFLPQEPEEMPEDSETEYSGPEDLRTAEMEVLDEDGETADAVETVETGSDLDAADEQDEVVTDTQEPEQPEKPDGQANPQNETPALTPNTSLPKGDADAPDETENNVPGHEPHGTSDAGSPMPNQEPQNLRFKNSGIGGSRTTDFEVQEPQNPRPNKIDISKKEKRENEKSQSVSPAPACAENAPMSDWTVPAYGETAPFACGQTAPFRDWTAPMDGLTDRQTDFGEGNNLRFILDSCELETFTPDTALLFENAVERLYYSQSVKIGNAILPQDWVRSRLYLLDGDILREAERKLSEYGGRRIRNRTAYTMTTIFNCIAEREDYLPRCFGASQYAGREGASCY